MLPLGFFFLIHYGGCVSSIALYMHFHFFLLETLMYIMVINWQLLVSLCFRAYTVWTIEVFYVYWMNFFFTAWKFDWWVSIIYIFLILICIWLSKVDSAHSFEYFLIREQNKGWGDPTISFTVNMKHSEKNVTKAGNVTWYSLRSCSRAWSLKFF